MQCAETIQVHSCEFKRSDTFNDSVSVPSSSPVVASSAGGCPIQVQLCLNL